MLILALLGWPFGALAVVLVQGRRGYDAVAPFAIAGGAAFALTGILLVMALVTEPEIALRFLFYGTATFGGAILSGLSAMVLWRQAGRGPAERRDRS